MLGGVVVGLAAKNFRYEGVVISFQFWSAMWLSYCCCKAVR